MNKLSIHILNAEECYTLNERLLAIFKTDLTADTVVSDVVPYLTQLNADWAAILTRLNGEPLTQELIEKDKARNAAFISFRDYCKSFIQSSDEVKVAAANKLTKLIRRVGWTLYNQGYAEHTASQEALIEALAETEYAEAVTAINASDHVSEMQTTNQAFEETVKNKIEVTAFGKVPSTNDCKRRMVKYLKPLLSYLELMAEIKSNGYAQVASKLSEEIDYVSASAKARRTRRVNR